MLTQTDTNKFASQYQTTTDNVIKEHYQILVLDIFNKKGVFNHLIFKGGTALRLAYNSYRFSEDLDFSIDKPFSFQQFQELLNSIPLTLQESNIQDLDNKKYTYFSRIVFNIEYKPVPIGIKIEVNKGDHQVIATPAIVQSPFNNLSPIVRVANLESILQDKIQILEEQTRRQPRDLFDAWFITQKLGKPFEIKESYKYNKTELMNKLNPFIPNNLSYVLKYFEK